MAGWFGNVEAVFEIQGVVNEFPVSHYSLGNPGLTSFVVHGGKSFSDNWVFFGGGGDFLCEDGINDLDMEVLVLSLQESDLPVVITGFDLILSREGISKSHVDSSFYPPPDIVFLQEHPPPCLLLAQILRLFEIPQVFVVRDHHYRMLGPSEVMAPFL